MGGLFLFAGPPITHPDFQEWQQTTIAQFVLFFKNCPTKWVAIEDQTLLHRVRTFQEFIYLWFSLTKVTKRKTE
jgi:hypothetical protein